MMPIASGNKNVIYQPMHFFCTKQIFLLFISRPKLLFLVFLGNFCWYYHYKRCFTVVFIHKFLPNDCSGKRQEFFDLNRTITGTARQVAAVS